MSEYDEGAVQGSPGADEGAWRPEEDEELDPDALAQVDVAQDEDEDEDVLVLQEVDAGLVLPVWEPTGEPRVDAALDVLATLDTDDVHQHPAVFEQIHQQLRATLTDLDMPT
jgi:hypothetical protein